MRKNCLWFVWSGCSGFGVFFLSDIDITMLVRFAGDFRNSCLICSPRVGTFFKSFKCRVTIRFKIIGKINFAIIIAHRAVRKVMIMFAVSFSM